MGGFGSAPQRRRNEGDNRWGRGHDWGQGHRLGE